MAAPRRTSSTTTKTTNKKPLCNPDYDKVDDIYKFFVRGLDGEPTPMEKYRGHVLIIVNIAGTQRKSFAYNNYKILNSLYKKYEEQGLRILAFPCKQHEMIERTKDIIQYAKENDVEFEIFGKTNVNCDKTSPLWKFLKTNVDPESPFKLAVITSSFVKFVVDRLGRPVKRFGPSATEEEIDLILQDCFYTIK